MQNDGVEGQGAVEEDVNCGRASEKVKVLGARRVWGTMSMCTTGTVQGVIRRICGLSSVRVKRKSRVSPSGKQQWWFDEESTLSALEDKWTSVETQTSWKLESCFEPVTSQNSVQTDAAVVSGDASTRVLNNEVLLLSQPALAELLPLPTLLFFLRPLLIRSLSFKVIQATLKTSLLFCTTALPF